MTRYATIEVNSGYVWWVGEAADPEAAIMASDAVDRTSAGQHRYVEVYGRIRDSDGGFYVYQVPHDFDAVAEQYDEVEKYPQVAAFAAHLIDEEEQRHDQ